MSRRLASSLVTLTLLAALNTTAAGQGVSREDRDPTGYLPELIEAAVKKNLSSERYWNILLHYEWSLIRGYTSQADGPGFFLSPKGKTDPRAELEATLGKFFSDELVGTSKQQAQCAFPARYHWLREQLEFDPARLPERDCARFKRWMSNLDPESVTLIFPSSYMNSPSSMFGHTLLRVDQKGQTEQTRILSYVINYAANVDRNTSFVYQLLGVVGGIKGTFSIMPYYLKVQEYSEMESRDIWEYRLSFNRQQIDRMLMHAWELGNTYFDYFFFKENCSYHLISLLEAADPDLHLKDRFHGWTIPADTIRLIRNQPGLVTEVTFRPSRSTEIERRRELLSGTEYSLVRRIIRDPGEMRSESMSALPPDRRAFVLDTSYDYVRYKGLAAYKDNKDPLSGIERKILEARSRLPVRSEPLAIEPITGAPETGHRTFRVGSGGGWQAGDSFEEFSIRAAYHDLLDRQEGYNPGSQIEAMDARFRYYDEAGKFRLHKLDVINILSLTPIDALFRKPSWSLAAGWENVPGPDTAGRRSFRINGGAGATFQTKFGRSEIYYLMAEAEGAYSRSFEHRVRAGAGGTGGIIVDLSSRWRIEFTERYLTFPTGNRSHDISRSLQQRFAVTTNLAVRAELERRNRSTQALLRLDLYL